MSLYEYNRFDSTEQEGIEPHQAQSCPQPHSSPSQFSQPSLNRKNVITRAAMGSACQNPNSALHARPSSNATESQAQASVSRESAMRALLPINSPSIRLRFASIGIIATES